jgi:hypothetical protein
MEVSPGPVATLRVVTWLDEDGEVSERGCYIRLGKRAQTHVVADDSISCAVDIGLGCIRTPCVTTDLAPCAAHPDTGTPFPGFPIPGVAAMLDQSKDLHGRFPFVRLIGWDWAVEEDGSVTLLEWNFQPGTAIIDPLVGPCFDGLGWEDYWRCSDTE